MGVVRPPNGSLAWVKMAFQLVILVIHFHSLSP